MNPLSYGPSDAFTQTWAPPTKAVRSVGPHIAVVRPHFSRVAVSDLPTTTGAESRVQCIGRVRTHLPTPHAGSCPLDYASLFVTLHRRQKENLMQAHASRPIPLLGRNIPIKSASNAAKAEVRPTAVFNARTHQSSQNVAAVPAAVDAARLSRAADSAHRAAAPEGLTVVEQAVPASVAAIMAQLTAPRASATETEPTSAAAAGTLPAPPPPSSPVSQARPPYHHHHHHHYHRHSAETRAPSTQHSPVMPQHHHHHRHSTSPQHAAPAVPSHQPPQQQQQQQQQAAHPHPQQMRYRVGRSGSTQLQPLPTTTNDAQVGVGAAGMVAAAAAEAAAREVATSLHRAASHRRSASPMVATSRPSRSLPRDAATSTPLSMALSSIRRSTTRATSSMSSMGGGGAGERGTMTRLTRVSGSLPNSSNSGNGNGLNEDAGVTTFPVDVETPSGLADTRMFLRPPSHGLRSDVDYAAWVARDDEDGGVAVAAALLAGTPGAASTLYRSSSNSNSGGTTNGRESETAGAGAATADRQRVLQLQLQRALQRQRQLERLMFHDVDDENAFSGGSEERDYAMYEEREGEDVEGTRRGAGGRRLDSVDNCGRLSGSQPSGEDIAEWEDNADDAEPLWRSSSSTTQHFLLADAPVEAAETDASAVHAAQIDPQQQQQQQEEQQRQLSELEVALRVPSVHPHTHISLHRFHETIALDGDDDDRSDLGIRADSVLAVPRGWGGLRGRGRSSTTSPSPQPDVPPPHRRPPQHQQRRHGLSGSSTTPTAEQSPVPVPAPARTRNAPPQTSHARQTLNPSSASVYPVSPSTAAAEGLLSPPATTAARSTAMAPASANRRSSSSSSTGSGSTDLASATAAAASAMSAMAATALRDPSLMEHLSPSLPQHFVMPCERYSRHHHHLPEQQQQPRSMTARTEESPTRQTTNNDFAEERVSESPTLPSPIKAETRGYRSSMPTAAFCDVVSEVTRWRRSRSSEVDAATAVAERKPQSAVTAATSSSSSSSSSPSWRRSSPQVAEESVALSMLRPGRQRVVLTDRTDEDVKEEDAASAALSRTQRHCRPCLSSPSISLDRQCAAESFSPSPTLHSEVKHRSGGAAAAGIENPASSGSFWHTEGEDDEVVQGGVDSEEDVDAPAVRRTSPGMSEASASSSAASSKCTRLSADARKSSSCASSVDSEGLHNGKRDRTSDALERSADLRRAASTASASPSPQQDAINAPLRQGDLPPATSKPAAAEVTNAVPLMCLSDMLRLSLSPGRFDDNNGEAENGGCDNCANTAGIPCPPVLSSATPRREMQEEAFPAAYNNVDEVDVQVAGGSDTVRVSGRHHEYVSTSLCDRYSGNVTTFDSPCSDVVGSAAHRNGLGSASISSSPPSPNRTAIRHAADLFREGDIDDESNDDDDDVGNNEEMTSCLSCHSEEKEKKAFSFLPGAHTPIRMPPPRALRVSTPLAATPADSSFNACTPLRPAAALTSSRLAMSTVERRLHASTASTVAWCASTTGPLLPPSQPTNTTTTPAVVAAAASRSTMVRLSLMQPRFSDESSLSITTDPRLTSATSTRSSASAVFSSPAESRLKSLLRASTWASANTTTTAAVTQIDEAGEEDEEKYEGEREEEDKNDDDDAFAGTRTPTRSAYAAEGNSSLTTPHVRRREEDPAAVAAAAFSPLESTVRPSIDATAATTTTTTMMPPPPFPPQHPQPSSPFRGSGSFLRLPHRWGSGLISAADDGRPSDGFEADIQLLARMTRMTTGATDAPAPPLTQPSDENAHPFEQPTQQEQQPSSPSASPNRFSTNSLSFFIAAAAPHSGESSWPPRPSTSLANPFSGDGEQSTRSGSGIYGSALAGRRSWAPRKARPQHRGKHHVQQQEHSKRSAHLSRPNRQLRLTSEQASSSPSPSQARVSFGDGGSSVYSNSGSFLPPQRLTFGSAITPHSAQLLTSSSTTTNTVTAAASLTAGSDSGERWSTALSTPTAAALAQSQQRRHIARPSLPSYADAVAAQTHEADTTVRSPSLSSLMGGHSPRQPSWVHSPPSGSPSVARTPSGRPSLSSTEFLQAPRRPARRDRHRSSAASSSYLAVPATPSQDSFYLARPFQRRSRSQEGSSSNDHLGSSYRCGGDAAPTRRARPARALSLSGLRSPSATATRLTWGTTTTIASAAASETRNGDVGSTPLFFSPFRPGDGGGDAQRSRSPAGCGSGSSSINFNSGSVTPLRVPNRRSSGSMMSMAMMGKDRASMMAAPSAQSTAPPLSLADELRSFSSPIFAGPPPPPPLSTVQPPPSPSPLTMPQRAAGSSFAFPPPPPSSTATFIASPSRRSHHPMSAGTTFIAAPQHAGAAQGSSLPPELHALLMRGSTATTSTLAAGEGALCPASPQLSSGDANQEFYTPEKRRSGREHVAMMASPTSSVKSPQPRRGCSERPEVNVDYAAPSPSPARQASP